MQRVLLERLVPYPRRLQAVAAVIRQLQRNGWLGLLAPKHLADLCPRLDDEPFVPQRGGTFAATGSRRARVAFFPGCVQNVLTPELNRATIRVLQRHGCEVVVIPATGCCGALHTHTGLTAAADRLREHNVRVYSGVQADVIVTNTSGCGAALKAYPPPVGERARDVTEFLVDLGLRSGSLAPMEVTVAYQDPCHLAHGQQIRRQPRELMAAIPGLKLVEMERPDQCCGSAGVYNLNQPHIAAELLKDRVEAFRRTGAQVLATANPGCMIQLGSMVPVAHVVELLDASSRINHAG